MKRITLFFFFSLLIFSYSDDEIVDNIYDKNFTFAPYYSLNLGLDPDFFQYNIEDEQIVKAELNNITILEMLKLLKSCGISSIKEIEVSKCNFTLDDLEKVNTEYKMNFSFGKNAINGIVLSIQKVNFTKNMFPIKISILLYSQENDYKRLFFNYFPPLIEVVDKEVQKELDFRLKKIDLIKERSKIAYPKTTLFFGILTVGSILIYKNSHDNFTLKTIGLFGGTICGGITILLPFQARKKSSLKKEQQKSYDDLKYKYGKYKEDRELYLKKINQ